MEKKTLLEILQYYKLFGLSDLEIIEQYFIQNHLESAAILMIPKLASSKINELYSHLSLMREYELGNSVLLCNKFKSVKEKDRIYELARIFMFRDLTKEEFTEAKKIYKENNIVICAPHFRAYLLEDKADESDKKALETFLQIRSEI